MNNRYPNQPRQPQRRRPSKRPNKSEVYLARFVLFVFMFVVLLLICGAIFLFTLFSGVSFRAENTEISSTAASPASTTLSAISEDVYFENKPDMGFIADLDDYEIYMDPADRDEYLFLINVDNPLDENYVPDDLVDVVDTRKDGRATQQMRLYAEKALEAMFIEMRANGFDDVSVTSAYRSYAQQSSNFNARMAQYTSSMSKEAAYAKTATIIAIPGTSEHQSGLCADLHNLPSALTAFAKEEAAIWLAANCHKFGFILRYPEDKTDVTGIIFEPWHFRYVGRYHATKIMESGLCLEEYMETLQ